MLPHLRYAKVGDFLADSWYPIDEMAILPDIRALVQLYVSFNKINKLQQ